MPPIAERPAVVEAIGSRGSISTSSAAGIDNLLDSSRRRPLDQRLKVNQGSGTAADQFEVEAIVHAGDPADDRRAVFAHQHHQPAAARVLAWDRAGLAVDRGCPVEMAVGLERQLDGRAAGALLCVPDHADLKARPAGFQALNSEDATHVAALGVARSRYGPVPTTVPARGD